ncbi:MAG: hypothetical protein ACJ8LG_12385 [Massilia sp.]
MRVLKTAALAIALWAPMSAFAGAWDLRLDGMGPLAIGMPFDSANARVNGVLKRTEAGLLASADCDIVELAGHPGVALMFRDDLLVRIDVSQPGPRTDTGVAVGDPVMRVREAYPRLKSSQHAYGDSEQYLTALSGDGRLAVRFETYNGNISTFYAGRFEAVQFIEGCL